MHNILSISSKKIITNLTTKIKTININAKHVALTTLYGTYGGAYFYSAHTENYDDVSKYLVYMMGGAFLTRSSYHLVKILKK